MKIDGYAVLAINKTGDKAVLKDRRCHNEKLENNIQWSDMHLEECLIPNGASDCLVMVFFNYYSARSSGGWWGADEYEETVEIVNYVVMQEGYKEFSREQISFLITFDGHAEFPREFETGEKEWIDELIEEWQELYDEDFELHEKHKEKYKSFEEIDWLE